MFAPVDDILGFLVTMRLMGVSTFPPAAGQGGDRIARFLTRRMIHKVANSEEYVVALVKFRSLVGDQRVPRLSAENGIRHCFHHRRNLLRPFGGCTPTSGAWSCRRCFHDLIFWNETKDVDLYSC